MARKKKESLHTLSVEDLKKQLIDAVRLLAERTKSRYTRDSQMTQSAKLLRHQIARIKTVLRVKEQTV